MKNKLEVISKKLKAVHKHFLENEKRAIEQRIGRKLHPLDFFNLLTQDESFAWMKPMSALMAEIDEFIDETENVTATDIAGIRSRIDDLLGDPSSKIAEQYLQYLAQDPELIIAHAQLREALGKH